MQFIDCELMGWPRRETTIVRVSGVVCLESGFECVCSSLVRTLGISWFSRRGKKTPTQFLPLVSL